jgi:tight adherence protein B
MVDRGVSLAEERGSLPRRKPVILNPYVIAGGLVVASVTGAAWLGREWMHEQAFTHPAVLPAIMVALVVTWSFLAGSLVVEYWALRRSWLARTARLTGMDRLAPVPLWRRVTQLLPDPLEWISRPLLSTRFGRRLADDWVAAGLGSKSSRYFVAIGLAALLGALLGWRVAGPMLGLALALVVPIAPWQFVSRRAEAGRRRFGEQLPQALDILAAGLAAGLSFQQAVEYARDELPLPVANAMAYQARRMALGYAAEAALQSLLEIYPEESLALAVDGIVLQRQIGGDMVAMLESMAGLLRERVELEQEVRAVTAQGRLSGVVIAALVPVSAGILLTANPRYIDVLFNSLIGQALLVFALILQLAGWAVISRLVRIRY